MQWRFGLLLGLCLGVVHCVDEEVIPCEGGECVKLHLCPNGVLNQDGISIIDIRFNPDNECEDYLLKCCPIPDIIADVPTTRKPNPSDGSAVPGGAGTGPAKPNKDHGHDNKHHHEVQQGHPGNGGNNADANCPCEPTPKPNAGSNDVLVSATEIPPNGTSSKNVIGPNDVPQIGGGPAVPGGDGKPGAPGGPGTVQKPNQPAHPTPQPADVKNKPQPGGGDSSNNDPGRPDGSNGDHHEGGEGHGHGKPPGSGAHDGADEAHGKGPNVPHGDDQKGPNKHHGDDQKGPNEHHGHDQKGSNEHHGHDQKGSNEHHGHDQKGSNEHHGHDQKGSNEHHGDHGPGKPAPVGPTPAPHPLPGVVDGKGDAGSGKPGDKGAIGTTTQNPLNIPDRCGKRNTDGVGFRITGASDGESQYGEFPWMVAILKEEKALEQVINVYQCGGSLIHPSVVLTAAHCVAGKTTDEVKVRLGEWDTQTKNEIYDYQDRNVVHIDTHADFNKGSLWNDVALLFLDKPAELMDTVNTICLPPAGTNFDMSRCFASGWGKDVFGKQGTYQVILKKIELPVMPHGNCQTALRKTRLGHRFLLHKSFICAGGEKGRDTCKGDGGSPLVCPIPGSDGHYYQAGMVAWGIGCGEDGVPGVYVNVAMFREWIDRHLRQRNITDSSYIY